MSTLRNIGNSQGVLIPKYLIEKAGLENHELVFELTEEGLLIKPLKKNRANWQSKIREALSKHEHDLDQEWLDSDLADLD